MTAVGSRAQRVRAASWWAWIRLPWRSPAVIGALLGSLALPAMVLASGAMFGASAGDSLAQRVVGGLTPGQAGLYLSAEGRLTGERVDPFAAAVGERLDAIGPLGRPDRVLIGDEEALTVDRGSSIDTDPRWKGRLFARDGATDSLELVAGSADGSGLLVSESLADDLAIGPGDRITVGSQQEPVPVAGVYADLWAEDRPDYWDGVPSQYVPRFLRAFSSPDFELLVATEDLLLDIGPPGRVAWHVPLDGFPTTVDALDRLTGGYRRLERDLVREGDLNLAYRQFAIDPEAAPSTATGLYEAADVAADLRAGLDAPLSAATLGGTVVGVGLSVLGAVFVIRRRNHEYRLLAADGDGPVAFFGSALTQFLGPALAGTMAGLLGAWALVSLIGPSGRADPGVIPLLPVAAVATLALLLAAGVTAVSAPRLADGLNRRAGSIDSRWMLFLLGGALAMWVQVGREQADRVNPLVVAFPLVGTVTGVVVVVVALRFGLVAARRTGARLPLPLFLAWRALTASDVGAQLVTAALGTATGFLALSAVFVTSIDVATEAKTVTVTGPGTRVDVLGAFDPGTLPDGSTVVRTTTTDLNPGRVEVLALDPATFDAITWPEALGPDARWLLDTLDQPVDGAIPVVRVDAHPAPSVGELGAIRRFPYQVVGTIGSVPLAASGHPTFIVRADVFERFARERFESGQEPVDPVEANEAEVLGRELTYESPLDGYGFTVLSTAPLDDVVTTLAGETKVRETATLEDALRTVDVESSRWAFQYLRILAAIGALTALGAMALYLAERRTEREVASVMTNQMGISPMVEVVASVVELVGLVSLSLAAGVISAVVTARRVFPTFEPLPDLPPVVGLVVAVPTLVAVMAAVVVAVAVVAVAAHQAAARTAKGRVLR